MGNTTCSVPGCDNPKRTTVYCGAHHQRILRHGDVRAHIPLRGRQNTADTLWCSRCEEGKPRTEFYRNRTTKSGYDGVCKVCVRKRHREQSVQRALRRKAWRDANRERINAEKRAAYHRDPDARTEAGREWRRQNPDRVRAQIKAQNAARYARLKSAPGVATVDQIQARWDYYGGKCWICGDPATDTDHVKPLAKGGSNWPSNLRPACRRCNRSKSAEWPYLLEVARRARPASRPEGAARPLAPVAVD